jgi:hypothetical protein
MAKRSRRAEKSSQSRSRKPQKTTSQPRLRNLSAWKKKRLGVAVTVQGTEETVEL